MQAVCLATKSLAKGEDDTRSDEIVRLYEGVCYYINATLLKPRTRDMALGYTYLFLFLLIYSFPWRAYRLHAASVEI